MSVIIDLGRYGINGATEIIHNPDFEWLYREETRADLESFERGVATASGAVAVDTGICTGCSPNDKYIVRDKTTRDTLW